MPPGRTSSATGCTRSCRKPRRACTDRNSMNCWSNPARFVVSQMKAFYGKNATRENEFGYRLHPKLPQTAPGVYENWSWAYIYDNMYAGKMQGLVDFGMNPVANGPHSKKAIEALSKLKWLVVAENF